MPVLIASVPQQETMYSISSDYMYSSAVSNVPSSSSVQHVQLPSITCSTAPVPISTESTAIKSPSLVTPQDNRRTVQLSDSLLEHVSLPANGATADATATVQVSSDDGGDASDSSPINNNNNAQSFSSSNTKKPATTTVTRRALSSSNNTGMRLNKFVRRLHDMLQSEQGSGICEWRRGLLVLHSTDAFAKTILPKYFNTRNFKTFRRQLNYYGFVHVRSFSTTGSTTTALWVNRDLAQHGTAHISSVLQLKRVEPCESAKTAEGRRVRKELAVSTVEDDIGVSAKSLQMEQIRSMAMHCSNGYGSAPSAAVVPQQQQQQKQQVPLFVHCPMPAPTVLVAPPPSLEYYQQPTGDNESAANLLLMLSKSSVPYQQ